MKLFVFVVAALSLAHLEFASGHGMMLSPPGRSSRWRYDSTAPVNYNDNELFCGGYMVQWSSNGGKCGLCGDNYVLPTPRPNELGGTYGGTGVIVETFENTFTAVIGFKITANHLGYVSFDVCDLDEFKVESEECFAKYTLKFTDGNDKYYIGSTKGWIDTTVVLPSGLSCEHCVLRWTYTAGNNWGMCDNGTSAEGCGPQETFKSCADVRILAPSVAKMSDVSDVLVNVNAEIPVIVE